MMCQLGSLGQNVLHAVAIDSATSMIWITSPAITSVGVSLYSIKTNGAKQGPLPPALLD